MLMSCGHECNNMTPQPERDWEKEFIDAFCSQVEGDWIRLRGLRVQEPLEFIRDVISKALEEERQRMLGKIDGLKEVYDKDSEFGDEGDEKAECDSEWNEAINEVLNLYKQSEE